MPPPAERSLAETYGAAFERLFVWMTLCDREFGARVAGRVDPGVLSDGGGRTVIEVHAEVTGTTGASATALTVGALLRERLSGARPGSPSADAAEAGLRYFKKTLTRKAPSESERRFVADSVGSFVTRRAVFAAMERSIDRYAKGDYAGIVEDVLAASREGDRTIAPSVGVDVYASAAGKLARYKERRTTTRKFPVGIRLIDRAFRSGGMEPRKLAFIFGPSARGKTLFLVQVGYCALREGKTVVHVSLEIDATEVEARYDARVSQEPINSFLSHDGSRAWAQRVAASVKRVRKAGAGRLFIKEYGAGELSVAGLAAYLDTVEQEAGARPDLVIVDYMDLMRSAGSYSPEYTRFALAEMARGLRNLARERDVAVWTASQTGRNSFAAKQIRMQDAAECIEKTQVADVILGFSQTDTEKTKGIARIVVLKNRLGGEEGLSVDVIVKGKTQTVSQNPAQSGGGKP